MAGVLVPQQSTRRAVPPRVRPQVGVFRPWGKISTPCRKLLLYNNQRSGNPVANQESYKRGRQLPPGRLSRGRNGTVVPPQADSRRDAPGGASTRLPHRPTWNAAFVVKNGVKIFPESRPESLDRYRRCNWQVRQSRPAHANRAASCIACALLTRRFTKTILSSSASAGGWPDLNCYVNVLIAGSSQDSPWRLRASNLHPGRPRCAVAQTEGDHSRSSRVLRARVLIINASCCPAEAGRPPPPMPESPLVKPAAGF